MPRSSAHKEFYNLEGPLARCPQSVLTLRIPRLQGTQLVSGSSRTSALEGTICSFRSDVRFNVLARESAELGSGGRRRDNWT